MRCIKTTVKLRSRIGTTEERARLRCELTDCSRGLQGLTNNECVHEPANREELRHMERILWPLIENDRKGSTTRLQDKVMPHHQA